VLTHEYLRLLKKQVSFFGRLKRVESRLLEEYFECANSLADTSQNKLKPEYKRGHFLHTTRSTVFLYWLSRSLFLADSKRRETVGLAEKLFLLNRQLNSVDLHYGIQMPKHFLINHGLGTVLSRAHYGDYFSILQGVTVGVQDQKYPSFGERVILLPNSVVVGNSFIGSNTIVGAGTVIVNKCIPENSVVIQRGGNLITRERDFENDLDYFIRS